MGILRYACARARARDRRGAGKKRGSGRKVLATAAAAAAAASAVTAVTAVILLYAGNKCAPLTHASAIARSPRFPVARFSVLLFRYSPPVFHSIASGAFSLTHAAMPRAAARVSRGE